MSKSYLARNTETDNITFTSSNTDNMPFYNDDRVIIKQNKLN